jgi:sulfate adenylyltransferase subunit 2
LDSHLQRLEQQSIFVLREARVKFKNLAMLWSMGKDSTTMLCLARRAFFGRVPFPCIYIDNGADFPETYAFRDQVASEWDVDVITAQAEPTVDEISGTAEGLNKAEALRRVLEERGFDGLIVSIRRDEHGVRAKERVFSPRDLAFRWRHKEQPAEIFRASSDFTEASHVRIHPLLHWTELDVWEYTRAQSIPVNPLYFARNGQRYRSLGYPETTVPVDSSASTLDEIIDELRTTAVSERSGRSQDKEAQYAMQRLREMGYM